MLCFEDSDCQWFDENMLVREEVKNWLSAFKDLTSGPLLCSWSFIYQISFPMNFFLYQGNLLLLYLIIIYIYIYYYLKLSISFPICVYSAVRVSSTFILVNKVNKKAKHLKKRIIITNRLKINLQINQFDIKKKNSRLVYQKWFGSTKSL